MRKLAIIHFNPIELYPPVMNWLNFIGSQPDQQMEVRVFTMRMDPAKPLFRPNNPSIKIRRSGQFTSRATAQKYSSYMAFYVNTILGLVTWGPESVLYYETLSSLPAWVYKKIISRRFGLFIHYHEYNSPAEYEQGGKLTRRLHRMEKKLYPIAAWISQTNEDRMHFFLDDHKMIPGTNQFILPNCPPHSWWTTRKRNVKDAPLKIIYIGALSLDTMYVKEFVSWVLDQQAKVIFDIYSSNITADAKIYLQSTNKKLVNYYEGVDYFSLPSILSAYDVGVILYKGHIPNYVYNVPNKLFEYMACGLDIWFPVGMKSALSLVTTNTFPQVKALDFSTLDQVTLSSIIDRNGLEYKRSEYNCENAFKSLFARIK